MKIAIDLNVFGICLGGVEIHLQLPETPAEQKPVDQVTKVISRWWVRRMAS